MLLVVADWPIEETTLRVSANKPETPEGPVFIQSEVWKKREFSRREEKDVAVGYGSDESFTPIGVGEKLKARRDKAVMKWHRRGKHVQVSTALPLWKSEKIMKHARSVGLALFGKENLADLRSIPTEKLPALAAQVRVRSYITDHFVVEAFGEVLTKNERLNEENEKLKEEIKKLKEANAKAYDPESPTFLNEIAVHLREGGEDALDLLRERRAFKVEHKNVSFDELFPAFHEFEAA